MKTLLRIAISLLAVAVVNCSSVRVQTDFDPGTNFSALRAYAWLADKQPPTGDPQIDNALLDARIRRAIDTQLVADGHEKTEPATADFLVGYHVAVDSKVDVDTIYRSYGRAGWGGGGSAETIVRQYDEGTLLIDLLHPQSGSLLWRGTATTRLREKQTPEARDKYVNEIVAEIFKKYPPK